MVAGAWSGTNLRLDRFFHSGDWILFSDQNAEYAELSGARGMDFVDAVDIGDCDALDRRRYGLALENPATPFRRAATDCHPALLSLGAASSACGPGAPHGNLDDRGYCSNHCVSGCGDG